LEEVWIATDDPRVQEAAGRFGAKCVMTDPSHRSGTDRIAEVVGAVAVERVVNLQADEPLLEPGMIDILLEGMEKDASIQIATLRHVILDERDLSNPNVVKVVRDRKGDALYFSRHPIPYVRSLDFPWDNSRFTAEQDGPWYKHIGIYAYTKSFLAAWKKLAPTPLELREGLEQLRVLEYGIRIRVFDSPYETLGVDTLEDLERVRGILEKK